VLHNLHDPAFGFERFFEVDLLRTQYLAYYLAADLLAYVTGVERANELLIAASLIGTPYAARALLRALGKDERLALLTFPLAFNAHLVLGFFNFLAAIPLSFYGVALALRQRRAPDRKRGLGLAVLAVVCFYTHVVPFSLLCLGALIAAPARHVRSSLQVLAPLLPALLAAGIWLSVSPAGSATLTAARGAEQGPRPVFQPAAAALRETPRWLTDVLDGDHDREQLYAWAALVAAVCLLAVCERAFRAVRARRKPVASAEPAALASAAPFADALGQRIALAFWLIPLACVALYFEAPTSYDWIWPIAQRFPLLAALWLVIALPNGRWLRRTLLVAAFALAVVSFRDAGRAFSRFDDEEVGDFDAALAAIPHAQRVVGLIFDRSSRNVAFSPFIHYVAYYQARKGGAVMFTFADFPQSPFTFREDNRPPRVPPRWEWMPERVRVKHDLAFYDYALVRGGPGAIARPGSGFSARYRGTHWSVWQHER